MATIVLTIPDAVLPRVIAASSAKFDYAENKVGAETQAQFAKRMIAETLKGWVIDMEGLAPVVTANASRAAIIADINANIAIT